MHIRIHQTGNLDLDTVSKMLCLADCQANFHPASRWILEGCIITEKEVLAIDNFVDGNSLDEYRDFFVKWIGREAVINWLSSNQIKFEIISFDFLSEEKEMIDEIDCDGEFIPRQIQIN